LVKKNEKILVNLVLISTFATVKFIRQKIQINMTRPKVLVIGSTNVDMVIKSEKLPTKGETVMGGSFYMNIGGKGANQAVAAVRAGGETVFVSKVGDDSFAKEAVTSFIKEGIHCKYIVHDEKNSTGIALIMVDNCGSNIISVASGANSTLSQYDVYAVIDELKHSKVVLMQLEIPVNLVAYITKFANKHLKPLILNPAPATALTDELLSKITFITPNETEAEILTGVRIDSEKTAKQAAEYLLNKGVKNVIITMGSQGVYIHNYEVSQLVPAPIVNAVDTTAAGDTFNGAFAVAIAEGKTLIEAAKFGIKAASISVTRLGAMQSAPTRKEILETEL